MLGRVDVHGLAVGAAAGPHPAAAPITMFQAAVLGLLQGVSELFPISSLGHTVWFPTLFGWTRLVKAQSDPTRLPFPNDEFDIIITSKTTHHMSADSN